jgi:hypothetical protein
MKATIIDPWTWYEITKNFQEQANITFDEALDIIYN